MYKYARYIISKSFDILTIITTIFNHACVLLETQFGLKCKLQNYRQHGVSFYMPQETLNPNPIVFTSLWNLSSKTYPITRVRAGHYLINEIISLMQLQTTEG